MTHTASNLWSALGVLGVVVLILYLAYAASRWIARHGAPGGASILPGAGGSGALRILAHTPVGRNERLVLLRLGERCLLLGVTERQITLLRELEGDEAAPWLREEGESAAPGFLELLTDKVRKKRSE